MKKSANRTVLTILAMIASVGTVHAESGKVEISNRKLAVFDELVKSGYLLPTDSPAWYQINTERLNDALGKSETGNAEALHTINKLKLIVGLDVDIKNVDIIEARFGSQDSGGE